MAARKSVTDEVILAAHARLGNGKAVARETGVHEQTVYHVLRRAQGVCPRCKAPTAFGKAQCQLCLDWDAGRVKQERKRRVRAAVCVQCGEPRCQASRLYCDPHRIAAAERTATYHARKRALRGSPQGEASSRSQKMRRLLETHGEAGCKRWDHADGACEICGTKYGDAAIHVHHVDRNPKHNVFDNLICLCFYCHAATHAMLRVPRLPDLLAWTERTYPAAFRS
jgi:hypothetical protein